MQCLNGWREHTLLSLLSKSSRKFQKIRFILSTSEGKNYSTATYEALSEIGEKQFFCFTKKRKEEIDHQNYSQAAALSSFKVGRIAVAAYFPLCKHWYFSPRHFRIAEAI